MPSGGAGEGMGRVWLESGACGDGVGAVGLAGLAGFGGAGTRGKYPAMERWEPSLTRSRES